MEKMSWNWAIGGITENIPRTAGPECSNFLMPRYRIGESLFITLLCALTMRSAVKRLAPIVLPSAVQLQQPHAPLRLALLITMTLVFGIEMGFKLSTRSVIYVLHPCHLQSILQIYLLAARPSKLTTALFRVQITYINGPFLAFLFPEVDGRLLPFQQAAYWIQHALLFIIPAYLLKKGVYTMENFNDYTWVTIGVSFMFIYHFGFLTALSMITSINLNHMLCPSPADPFEGQFYRLAAFVHETLLCPILYKLTVLAFHGRHGEKTSPPLYERVVNLTRTAAVDGFNGENWQQRQKVSNTDFEHMETLEGYSMTTTKID